MELIQNTEVCVVVEHIFFTKNFRIEERILLAMHFMRLNIYLEQEVKFISKLRSIDPKIIVKHLQNELHKNIMIKPGLSQKCILADE